MLDHFNIPVSHIEHSNRLYRPLLSLLGMQELYRDEYVIGYGDSHWVFGLERVDHPINPLHFALRASSNAQVAQFYNLALEHGARDNGAPGLRAEYGAHYFAAYVLDLDGHNLEVVHRGE
ncbi:MAG: VOC family protein [Granulosicoccaceae bacterium]